MLKIVTLLKINYSLCAIKNTQQHKFTQKFELFMGTFFLTQSTLNNHKNYVDLCWANNCQNQSWIYKLSAKMEKAE